jgi:hypothetical protein
MTDRRSPHYLFQCERCYGVSYRPVAAHSVARKCHSKAVGPVREFFLHPVFLDATRRLCGEHADRLGGRSGEARHKPPSNFFVELILCQYYADRARADGYAGIVARRPPARQRTRTELVRGRQ